jgi:hypothetical protein
MRLSRPRQRSIAALAAVALMAAITAGDAGALSAPVAGGPGGADVCAAQATAARAVATVANLRAFGDCEVSRRQTTLTQLAGVVAGSRTLTPADVAALNIDINNTSTELATLKTAIDSEATVVALKATIVQVVNRCRVYVLLVPQVRLTVAAEDVLSLQPHLAQLSSSVASRIAQAKAAGKNITAAQTSLDAMNSSLDQAELLAAAWPSRLVSLTPARYDSGAAAPVLQQARVALGKASALLKLAVADGRAALAALR